MAGTRLGIHRTFLPAALRACATLLLIVAAGAPAAVAQSTGGTITGVIRDGTGAVLPGAWMH